MLVEGDEGIGLVTGVEDFAGAEVDLENGGATRDRAGDGHVGHDLLGGRSCKLTEKGSHRLDSVLGITGKSNDGIAEIGGFGGRGCCLRHERG